jgi:hypothetical protein
MDGSSPSSGKEGEDGSGSPNCHQILQQMIHEVQNEDSSDTVPAPKTFRKERLNMFIFQFERNITVYLKFWTVPVWIIFGSSTKQFFWLF